jgi:hypothetical protein
MATPILHSKLITQSVSLVDGDLCMLPPAVESTFAVGRLLQEVCVALYHPKLKSPQLFNAAMPLPQYILISVKDVQLGSVYTERERSEECRSTWTQHMSNRVQPHYLLAIFTIM